MLPKCSKFFHNKKSTFYYVIKVGHLSTKFPYSACLPSTLQDFPAIRMVWSKPFTKPQGSLKIPDLNLLWCPSQDCWSGVYLKVRRICGNAEPLAVHTRRRRCQSFVGFSDSTCVCTFFVAILLPQNPQQRWHETARYGFYFMPGVRPPASR
jgi:hypothetical protein